MAKRSRELPDSLEKVTRLISHQAVKTAALKQALRFGPVEAKEVFQKTVYLVAETRWISSGLVREYPALAGWIVSCLPIVVKTGEQAYFLHSFLARNIVMLLHKELPQPDRHSAQVTVYARPDTGEYWDHQQRKHLLEVVQLLKTEGVAESQVEVVEVPEMGHVIWDGQQVWVLKRDGSLVEA